MSQIVVFGAGGRAGRVAVAEARRRGHGVTAVVRDPRRHDGLSGDRVSVAAGDVTTVDSVATLAAGHDAAICAVYDPTVRYTDVARSLLDGLPRAGVSRVTVQVGTPPSPRPRVPPRRRSGRGCGP